MPSTLRRALVALVVLTTFVAAAATATASVQSTPQPVSGIAATPGPHGTLDISWTTPDAGAAAVLTNVAVLDLDRPAASGQLYGLPATCGDCESLSLDHLVPGRRYQVVVNRWNDAGYSDNASGPIVRMPVDAACESAAGNCVVVDATAPTDVPADNRFNGLLHGADPAPDASLVDRIAPPRWRVAAQDPEAFDAARDAGAKVTVMIDAAWNRWGGADRPGGNASPWEDWATYELFVANVVRWHRDTGRLPEYFEVMNEPTAGSYDTALPPDRAKVLEQYRRAHDAIRSVLPDAKILGPSINQFVYNDPTGLIDLRSFLDMVEREGIRYDALNWHEIGGGQPKYKTFEGSPRAVSPHIRAARALLDARPAFRDVKIMVNEYMSPWGRMQPSYAVGYLASLVGSGADGANRTCWPDVVDGKPTCWRPMLDGLLTSAGVPTASYWVHAAYAAQRGAVLGASATDPDTSVLAAAGDDGVVRGIVGRHADIAGSVATTVAVRVPLAAGWELDVTHLPYHPTEGLPAPVTSTTTVLAPLDGIVRVPIASLAAGDAWTFELRPIGPVLDEPAPTTTTTTSTTTTSTTTTRPTTTTTAAKGKPGKPTATTTTQPTTTTAPKGKGKPRW